MENNSKLLNGNGKIRNHLFYYFLLVGFCNFISAKDENILYSDSLIISATLFKEYNEYKLAKSFEFPFSDYKKLYPEKFVVELNDIAEYLSQRGEKTNGIVNLSKGSLGQENILWNTFFSRDNIGKHIDEKGNLEKQWDVGTCSHEEPFSIKSNLTVCKVNEFEVIQPDFLTLIKYFCVSLNLNNIDPVCRANDSSKEMFISKLESYFPKLKIVTYVHKYKFGKDFIPIEGMSSVEVSSSDGRINALLVNYLEEAELQIENSVSKCTLNHGSQKENESTCTMLSENSSYLSSFYSLKLNKYFNSFNDWTCVVNDISLMRVYKTGKLYSEDFVYRLFPVYKLICESSEPKRKVSFTIDAINGTLLQNIKEIVINAIESDPSSNNLHNMPYVYSSEDCSVFKGQSNIKRVCNTINTIKLASKLDVKLKSQYVLFQVNLIQKLFKAVLSPQNLDIFPYRNLSIFLKNNCNDICGQNISFACSVSNKNENKLCLGGNDSNVYSFDDPTIISHEYIHNLVPEIINLFELRKQPIKKTILRNRISDLFHDFADAASNSIIGSDCIGEIYSTSPNCKQGEFLPRLIDSSDSLTSNIPLKKDSYKRGEVIARMLQIAKLTMLNKNSNMNTIGNSNVIGHISHWIYMIRSLIIYNDSNIPCVNCDLDFYIAQQMIMFLYSSQIETEYNSRLKNDLLFNWAEEGYVEKNYSCIDSIRKYTGDCKFYKNELSNLASIDEYYGLSLVKINSSKSDYKEELKLQVITGVPYQIGINYQLIKNDKPSLNCNKYIEIRLIPGGIKEFDNESIIFSFKLENEEASDALMENNFVFNNGCLVDLTIKGERYKKFISKNIDLDIFIDVRTFKNKDKKFGSNNVMENPKIVPSIEFK